MAAPHIPVLITPLLKAVALVDGLWVDGTFGAGGYARSLIEAGADRVIGIDRDPSVAALTAEWRAQEPRVTLREGRFSQMDEIIVEEDGPVAGLVLDLGVSSMQLDQAERGFSFMRDGPLDMRMGADGPTAAEWLNDAPQDEIADVIHHYGEERAARRIARTIVASRPITRTAQLAEIVAGCLPRPKPNQAHPATRSFQAIRIHINDEFGELIAGLEAAERLLPEGGKLAVVSFHSLEDRVVKRFLQGRSGRAGGGSRHAPQVVNRPASFDLLSRRGITAGDTELARNPRSRSATLRVAQRTDAPAWPADRDGLGLPAEPGARR